jgi:hypothetical protein
LAFEGFVVGEVIGAEGFGDFVIFAEPCAEVDELAARGAEGAQGVGVEIVFVPAGGAFYEGGLWHGETIPDELDGGKK